MDDLLEDILAERSLSKTATCKMHREGSNSSEIQSTSGIRR